MQIFSRSSSLFAVAMLGFGLLAGCGPSGPAYAPVEGKVIFDGKPLEFGSIQFQPDQGPAASAKINPDGTFKLKTGDKDGAVVGKHRVRIVSYSGQAKPADIKKTEASLGELRTPDEYSSFGTTPLKVEVKAEGNAPFEFTLAKPPKM